MPEFQLALLSLGYLTGIFDPDDGKLRFEWVTDPLGHSLTAMQDNRVHLGSMFQALLDRPRGAAQSFSDGHSWEPLNIGDAVEIGLVWNDAGDPLALSLGGKATFGAAQSGLTIRGRLVDIADSGPTVRLGQLEFSGDLPVPEFLDKATVAGSLTPVVVELHAFDAQGREALVTPSSAAPAWDAARLAVFVLRAWVHSRAGETVFKRVDEHLFPMLGDTSAPGQIKPFPLVDAHWGQEPSFTEWKDSVLNPSDQSGAIGFLWHLRALLTGNEDPKFFEGSWYFALEGPPLEVSGPDFTPHEGEMGPGAYVGIQSDGGLCTLVLHLLDGDDALTIALAQHKPGQAELTRPDIDADAIQGFLEASGGAFDGVVELSGTRVTLTPLALPGAGDFVPALELPDGVGPVRLTVLSPALEIALPPSGDPNRLLTDAVAWLLDAVPSSQAPDDVLAVARSMWDQVRGAVPGGDEASPHGLVLALVDALVDVPGPLTIAASDTSLEVGLDLGPIAPGQLQLPLHIGRLAVAATFDLDPSPELDGLRVEVTDLRLGDDAGAATGLAATLIPDMRGVPGFHLLADWHSDTGLSLEGGGKVPVQQQIGPVQLRALLVEIDGSESLSLGLDLSLELGGVRVSAFELGLRLDFEEGRLAAFLHGLGVGFDSGGVRLVGMFAEVGKPGSTVSDYAGAAVVSITGLFELAAIGGYTRLGDGSSSMFIFASLVAPLGGPPWCFITGIAGGFGYNRALPPAGLLAEHPFLKVMNGEIELEGEGAEQLAALGEHFAAQPDQHWIAAGIQFTSFGFIDGKLVVAVGLGHEFSLHVLGEAGFGLSPLARFDLAFESTADKELLLVKAAAKPSSYIIHPDISSLRGEFGLAVWHSGTHAGDFVLSIGGYHPSFVRPQHYPDIRRVEVNAIVWGWVRLSAECFFACSPQALMAGAKVTLSGEFEGIAAGLDVYVDVFMTWDPFFLLARMSVAVWFEFFGRHEVEVALEIHTPPFGGLATIDILGLSFDVEFGERLAAPPAPRLHELIRDTLEVPATSWAGVGAKVARFSSDDVAGLFAVLVDHGRTRGGMPAQSSAQEGLANPAIMIDSEFGISVRTKLPLRPVPFFGSLPTGHVNLPLCGKLGLVSSLDLTVAGESGPVAPSDVDWLWDHFPAATFGAQALPSAHADDVDARKAVASLSAEPTVALVEGAALDFRATLQPQPPNARVESGDFEEPSAEELLPLPLGEGPAGKRVTLVARNDMKTVVGAQSHVLPRRVVVGRRHLAREQGLSPERSALRVSARSTGLRRVLVDTRYAALTVATAPAGAPVIKPPPSPARRQELFGICLRAVAPRGPHPVGSAAPKSLAPARDVQTSLLTPAEGTTDPVRATLSVPVAGALQIDLSNDPRSARIVLDGRQTVRCVFLGGAGDLVGHAYVKANATLELPPRARRAVLIGEGRQPPVDADARVPVARVAVGIEHDSVLLALDAKMFAAHGCVVESRTPLPFAARPLDSVRGTHVLRAARQLDLAIAAVAQDAALVIRVRPRVARPEHASGQVRWSSLDAVLTDLDTVISPAEVAFVMTVTTSRPWSLRIDLGPDWRLVGVAVSPRRAQLVASDLRARASWDLIDDRLAAAPDDASTDIALEAEP